MNDREQLHAARPVIIAGIVLGIGLGGFADGILLHQILQWHNMLSSWVPPIDLVSTKVNMVWDGLFHAFTWLTTLAGIALLVRAAQRTRGDVPGLAVGGSMIVGWGLFNLVEGVIDHLVLGVHHVRPGEGQLAWDIGFVTIGGIGLILVGSLLLVGHPSSMLRSCPPTRSSSPAH